MRRKLKNFVPRFAVEVAGRPLFAASIALVAGVSAAWHPVNVIFLLTLLATCVKKLRSLLIVSAAFFVGLLIAPPQFAYSSATKGRWEGQGTVTTSPSLSRLGESCILSTDSGRLQLVVRGRVGLALGERLRLSGNVLPLHGEFGQLLLLEDVAATVVAWPRDILVEGEAPRWFEWSNALRDSFMGGMGRSGEPWATSMAEAVCFGGSNSLGASRRQELARSGVAHVLSVSGLQVFLVGFLCQFLLSMLPVPRWAQLSTTAVLLCLYASATGLHPSTMRAVIVAIVGGAAYLFRREHDFLSALGLAAIVTVCWQPWSIYLPGFQISYLTVGAISLYWKPFWSRNPRRAVDKVASRLWFLTRTSLVACLAVAPLTAYHFGQVSLVSPFTNLLVAPVLPVVVLVSLLSWPIGLAVPAIQIGLLRLIVAPLVGWVSFVVGLFGRQSWSALEVPTFNPYWLVLYYGAFLLLWDRKGKT